MSQFFHRQSLIEIYSNYQAIKACKNLTYICSYAKNPCCRYVNVNQTNPCGNSDCLYWNENYWTWEKPGLLKFVACMLVQFLVQTIILLCMEAGFFKKLKYWLSNCSKSYQTDMLMEQASIEKLYGDVAKDFDVVQEEKRISKIDPRIGYNEILIVDKLTKYYSNFVAVKGISFAMNKSECFGLLGRH